MFPVAHPSIPVSMKLCISGTLLHARKHMKEVTDIGSSVDSVVALHLNTQKQSIYIHLITTSFSDCTFY